MFFFFLWSDQFMCRNWCIVVKVPLPLSLLCQCGVCEKLVRITGPYQCHCTVISMTDCSWPSSTSQHSHNDVLHWNGFICIHNINLNISLKLWKWENRKYETGKIVTYIHLQYSLRRCRVLDLRHSDADNKNGIVHFRGVCNFTTTTFLEWTWKIL